MLLPGDNNPKFWLFITILVSSIIAFSESSGAKTHSAEYNPRAVDDASSSDSDSKKTSPRADSSESEHERPKKEDSSKETLKGKGSKSSADSSDSDDAESKGASEDTLRSTRGLKAADFEPEEENPKLHGRYHGSGSDNDGRRQRYKRHGKM